MKRILITGATGLVGGAIYERLKTDNAYAITCVSSKPQNDSNFITCDLSKENNDLSSLCGACDIVIHCAVALPNDIGDELSGIQNRKIDNTVYLYALQNSPSVFYVSSAFLYDLSQNNYKCEQDELISHSDYHAAKIDGERLFNKLDNSIIARISSPYGKNIKTRNVLNIFSRAAQNGTDIILQDSGERMQDFIHVEDIAHFAHQALSAWKSGIYNVVYGRPHTMKELAETCINIKSGSQIILQESHGEWSPYYALFSNKKALDILNWKPVIDLKEGLKDIIHA